MLRFDRCLATLLALAAALVVLAGPAAARSAAAFKETLSSQELKVFEEYIAARSVFDFKLDAYWREVTDKRALRRKRKAAKLDLRDEDYVQAFPPEYKGPYLSVALQKRWSEFQAADRGPRPAADPKPTIKEFLSLARAHYGFAPERVPEREFKRRYAREALSLGLTKDQVVRIYALETSGLGTADMVAGIHPITKKGAPISTAIGYAQLLAANTINEIRKSGPAFIERLEHKKHQHPEQAAALDSKIAALRKMTANARTVPDVWSKQVAHARTGKGLGMHALNVDGDIGPWLQAIKIKGLKISASRNGRDNLSGAEIELMNLAGPGTGLEMMLPAGRRAPTPNFFERLAYGRNTIVRGKTSKQLLTALDDRMNANVKNSGAVEFAEVFDELMAERQAQR